MTTEERLRQALEWHDRTVETEGPDWSAIEDRAASLTRARRLRRLTALGAVAAAAALVAVVLATVPDGQEERGLRVTDRAGGTTTTLEPTTTTTPVVVAGDPSAVGGIYPDAAAYERDGIDRYRDPAVAARAFATEYLGMPTPVLGAVHGRSVELRPSRRSTLVTTLTLAPVGEGGPWTVTAARAARIVVTKPTAAERVGSPMAVAGRAQAFEGHVDVEVRQDGMRAGSALGRSFVTGAGDTMGPFEGAVSFRRPGEGAGAVLFIDRSAEDGSPIAATVVRIRFGGRGAPISSTTTTRPRERLSSASVIRFDGLGPVQLGMSESEARQAAGVPLRASEFGACRSLEPEGEPAGVALALVDGARVNVIFVVSGRTATDRGVRIGSTEAEVLAAYPGGEVRNPEEPRHWVFARTEAFAMVFEIEDGNVVAYRTGLRQVIEQDEICA